MRIAPAVQNSPALYSAVLALDPKSGKIKW